MFEKTIIRRHDRRASRMVIDPGLLAETLLFYGHVHLLMDGGTLQSLLSTVGPGAVLSLLRSDRASATILSDSLGVMSRTVPPITYHQYSAFTISADKNRRIISPEESLYRTIEHVLGKSSNTKRFAKELIKLVQFRAQEPVKHLADGSVVAIDPSGITAQVKLDTLDLRYMHDAIEAILRAEVPTYKPPAQWTIDVIDTGVNGFVCSTSLSFEQINNEYHKFTSPTENSITMAWLMGQLFQVRADLHFAADYMSEFVTDSLSSNLARMRFNDMLKRRTKSAAAIEGFLSAELRDATAIREVINSGERSFDEFMLLLDKADRFKEWLRGRNPDVNLLAEYHREVTRQTWIEKLPAKVVRFAFCTLAGIGLDVLMPGGGGLGAGVAVTAADAFLLERLARGWRPNQFVEGPLLRFVDR